MPKRERDTTSTDSHILSRRDFVSRTSLVAAGLAIGPLLRTGSSDRSAGVDHLRENLGALEIKLTAAELSALDADFSKLTVHGGRTNEIQMRAVERAG